MGALISKWRGEDENDYEKILAALDDKIRQAEIRLSEVKVRERRVVILWLVYSVFFYVLYLLAYVTYLRFHLNAQNWLPLSSPLVLAPIGIHLIRNLIYVYYERRKSNEEVNLEALLTRQKHKVEELKQKNAYYSTKSLLERYESPNRTPGILKAGKARAAATPSTPTRQPPHSTPAVITTPSNGLTTGASPAVSDARLRAPPKTAVRSMINSAQPQTPSFTPQQKVTPNMSIPTPYARQTPQPRAWYDKLVDVVIGDEGPETKYAIICEQCFAHNGLVVAEELEVIQYVCPKCNHFNQSRRKRREGVNGASGVDGDVMKPSVLKNSGIKMSLTTSSNGSNGSQRFSSKAKENDDAVKSDLGTVARKQMLLRTSSRGNASQSPVVSSSTPRHSSRLRNPISPDSSPSPSPTPLEYTTGDARETSDGGSEELEGEGAEESENLSENEGEIATAKALEDQEDERKKRDEEELEVRQKEEEEEEEEEEAEVLRKKAVGVRKKKKGRRG